MRKTVIIISIFAFIAGGCGQNNTSNKHDVETQNDTLQNSSISQKINGQEEWNFIISPPNVGLISTENNISEIPDLLPIGYSMVKDSTIWDNLDEDENKWEYDVYYAVCKGNKTIFKIYAKENTNEIATIVILSPEYKIKNTELRVGSTFGALKKTFSIKNWEFNFDWGLHVYCNGFNGTFEIDLDGEGRDDPNLLELLPDIKKIGKIVVYK